MPLISSPIAIARAPAEQGGNRLFRMSAARRDVPRVKLALGGRVMLESRVEHGATALAASVRSMAIEAQVSPQPGERIIGYFYTIGRVEGRVSEVSDKGFVIDLVTSPLKRERLAGQLTWLANREMLNLPEDRRHDRIVPRDPSIMVRQMSDPSGALHPGHLIDVSRSGAAASVRGPTFRKGDEVMLGSTPAKVVRAFDGGIAVEFYGAVPDAMFSEDIRL